MSGALIYHKFRRVCLAHVQRQPLYALQECLAGLVSLCVNLTHNSQERCKEMVKLRIQEAVRQIMQKASLLLTQKTGGEKSGAQGWQHAWLIEELNRY